MIVFIHATKNNTDGERSTSLSLISHKNGVIVEELNLSYQIGNSLPISSKHVPYYRAKADCIAFFDKYPYLLATFNPENETLNSFLADYNLPLPKDRIIYVSSIVANSLGNACLESLPKFDIHSLAAFYGVTILGKSAHEINKAVREIYLHSQKVT